MQILKYQARNTHFCNEESVYAFGVRLWGKTHLRIFSRYQNHIIITDQLKSSYLNTVIETPEIVRDWLSISFTTVINNWIEHDNHRS